MGEEKLLSIGRVVRHIKWLTFCRTVSKRGAANIMTAAVISPLPLVVPALTGATGKGTTKANSGPDHDRRSAPAPKQHRCVPGHGRVFVVAIVEAFALLRLNPSHVESHAIRALVNDSSRPSC